MCGPRLRWLSLQLQLDLLLLGLLAQLLVLLDAGEEVLSALGVGHMLNPDVDAFRDDPVAHTLINDDAKGPLGHVVDTTGLAVVRLVGHALLHGSIALYINDVANFVDLHVGRKGDDAMLLEFAGEEIARTATVPLGVRHRWLLGS